MTLSPGAERSASPTLDAPCSAPSRVAYGLFFLSGAAGLIYEVSWSRQIGLLFGHSGHTAAVVLGSYFAGMAIGYLIAARLSTRMRPLRGYAIAEILAASWAALVPSLLDLLPGAIPAAILDHPSLAVRTVSRAAIGFLALLPASVAIGATLPFMAQYLDPDRKGSASGRVATAYAMNTLGALVGVVAATGVMLLVVGVRGSGYAAAGIAAFCGIVALMLPDRAPVGGFPDEPAGPADRGERLLWLAVVAIAGFGTLAVEVLFTRMFALVFQNSTYTFGLVVAFFLLGLALGSAWVARSRGNPGRVAGWAALLGSAAEAVCVPFFSWITGLGYFGLGQGFGMYMAGASLLVAAVVLPPVALLGAILPASWGEAERRGVASGRAVGRLTAANTLAAASGSLAASFVIAPAVGLWTAFGLIAGMFAVLGVILLWRAGDRFAPILAVPVLGTLIPLAIVGARDRQATAPGSEILRRWEGPYGRVDVVRERASNQLTIRQNLHYGLGSSRAAARELVQGHLPLLLHPDPKDVLFLGVGTGLTAASSLDHPEVRSVTAVELNADVVAASRAFFREANRGVLDDPRVTVVVDDARHFLTRTDRKFDAIISDLFVPWESQTGYLYTVEHYKEALAHLKPGGVFCQWLAMYQVGEREFESIADSLASVFPVTSLWWGQVDPELSFVALIGTREPIDLDLRKLEPRLDHLRRRPEEQDSYLLRSPSTFLIHHGGRWTVRNPDRLNTDEHPRVEFLAPLTHRDGDVLVQSKLRSFNTRVLSTLTKDEVRVQP